jgi:hypothetical protein
VVDDDRGVEFLAEAFEAGGKGSNGSGFGK